MNGRGERIAGLKAVSAIAATVVLAISACAPSGSQTPTSALEEIGCNFDSKKICERALKTPVANSSGITTSNQSYFQQNAPATVWEQVPIKAPGGSEVDVQCQIDTQNKFVVYAYATPNGTVTDSDRGWLQSAGYCSGIPATIAPPAAKAED
ncbi:MAG: hypothetical protein ACLQDV_10860 [Candidatus Binataceae bacterium]